MCKAFKWVSTPSNEDVIVIIDSKTWCSPRRGSSWLPFRKNLVAVIDSHLGKKGWVLMLLKTEDIVLDLHSVEIFDIDMLSASNLRKDHFVTIVGK